MRYFVVPASPDAQIPDPDRGGTIPLGGTVLKASGRLASYIARGDVIATPIDAVVPPAAPDINPNVATLTLQHGGYVREIAVRDFEAYLATPGRPIPEAAAATFAILIRDFHANLPSSLPVTPGKLWNNGGLLSIS